MKKPSLSNLKKCRTFQLLLQNNIRHTGHHFVYIFPCCLRGTTPEPSQAKIQRTCSTRSNSETTGRCSLPHSLCPEPCIPPYDLGNDFPFDVSQPVF